MRDLYAFKRRIVRCSAFVFLLTLFPFLGLTTVSQPASALGWHNSMEMQRVTLERDDGVKLAGSLFLPKHSLDGELMPAIVQINPWSVTGDVYYLQARRLADMGFVVLSYTARGFGLSGGKINGGGPQDVQDAIAWIDWLVANNRVDEKRIGMMGISLGAGITLLTAAADPRINVVATLSGWGDFYRVMKEQGTVPDVWEGVLIWAGKTLGRMDDKLRTFMESVRAYTMPEDKMHEFATVRSPITYIDTYNRRGVAIYMQHNYQDYLFATNQVIDFFNQLTTEKKLDLNFGVHVTPEFFALGNPNSKLWGRVMDWFYDRLATRPVGTPLRTEPYLVSSQVKFRKDRLQFNAWPPQVDERTFDLSYDPTESATGQMSIQQSEIPRDAQKTIESGAYSGINTGIPIFSAAMEAHFRIPIMQFTQAMARKGAMIFSSPVMTEQSLMFGAAHADLWIVPSAPKIQLVGYLFSVNKFGLATLITHAPLTFLDGKPGEPRRVEWNLIYSAHEIAQGNKLMFAIDTYDPYYSRPSKDPYSVTFLFGEKYPATLTVPFL